MRSNQLSFVPYQRRQNLAVPTLPRPYLDDGVLRLDGKECQRLLGVTSGVTHDVGNRPDRAAYGLPYHFLLLRLQPGRRRGRRRCGLPVNQAGSNQQSTADETLQHPYLHGLENRRRGSPADLSDLLMHLHSSNGTCFSRCQSLYKVSLSQLHTLWFKLLRLPKDPLCSISAREFRN